jgi:uncharacterized membrane protein YesL
MRIRQETYTRIFETVYVGMTVNLLLTVAGLPVVVLLLTTDPGRSWPLLALLAPLAAPGVCAAFAVLGARTTAVFRTFVLAWRRVFRRAFALGAASSALLVVLAVDIRAAWGHPAGAVAIPVLVVAILLVTATTLLALVVLAERPAARLRDAVRVSVFLAVRHWHLTALSLAVLGLFELLLATRPAIALGLAAAPLLYVVWAGSRFSLNPALGLVSVSGSPTRGPA